MNICVCEAIGVRDIEAAVRAGARRPTDVFRACGKRPQCGGCAPELRKRIGEIVNRERISAATELAAD